MDCGKITFWWFSNLEELIEKMFQGCSGPHIGLNIFEIQQHRLINCDVVNINNVVHNWWGKDNKDPFKEFKQNFISLFMQEFKQKSQ